MKVLCKHQIDISKFDCKKCLKEEISTLKDELNKSERQEENNFIAMEEAQEEHNKRVEEIKQFKDKLRRCKKQIKNLQGRIGDLLARGICTSENPCDCMTNKY